MNEANQELKAEIIRQHGSQYRFAAKLGIQESIVSSVIRGRRSLSESERQRWAERLGVAPEKLFRTN